MKAGSRAECDALTRYLIGLAADDYVADQYRRGVEQLQIRESRFDRLLCSWARRSRPTARAADFYGRLFRPAGALRRKLVLLLAILESYGPTAAVTDRAPGPRGFWAFCVQMIFHGLGSVLALAIGLPLLLPLQLVLGGGDR